MSKNAVNNLINLPLFCQVTLSRGDFFISIFSPPYGGMGGKIIIFVPFLKLLIVHYQNYEEI
jgi:hypothetical protein